MLFCKFIAIDFDIVSELKTKLPQLHLTSFLISSECQVMKVIMELQPRHLQINWYEDMVVLLIIACLHLFVCSITEFDLIIVVNECNYTQLDLNVLYTMCGNNVSTISLDYSLRANFLMSFTSQNFTKINVFVPPNKLV